MRGETRAPRPFWGLHVDFNPLPSCEGRRSQANHEERASDFNPLPSCEGRHKGEPFTAHNILFQSTPLMRGETVFKMKIATINNISIHSPHARGDKKRDTAHVRTNDFNPLPSCEGRLGMRFSHFSAMSIFQSTPLMRGETYSDKTATDQPITFQSTPLMRGETRAPRPFWGLHVDFNPLPSCEGRRYGCAVRLFCKHFNPLPSCEGRHLSRRGRNDMPIFQSTPLMRGETPGDAKPMFRYQFQSTPLMRGETA